MIKNGLGIIAIPIDLIGDYQTELIRFYETNDSKYLKDFIYNNCIDGVGEDE